jgi:hypothetical protein
MYDVSPKSRRSNEPFGYPSASSNAPMPTKSGLEITPPKSKITVLIVTGGKLPTHDAGPPQHAVCTGASASITLPIAAA